MIVRGTYLGIIARVKTTLLDVLRDTRLQWTRHDVEPVVLVGGLGEALLARLRGYSFTVRHHRVGDLHLRTHEVLLKILETDLQVQLQCKFIEVQNVKNTSKKGG